MGCASYDVVNSLVEVMTKKHSSSRSQAPVRDLVNDTVINVSQLLHQETVGETRRYRIQLDWFVLDNDLMARDITGEIKLLRVGEGIMVIGTIRGLALMECVRCLNSYEQPFEAEIEQEYRSMFDIIDQSLSGEIDPDPNQEIGEIDEFNQIDLSEQLRQFIILALPIQPVCGPDCPGPPIDTTPEDRLDPRFAALQELLDDQSQGIDE